MIKAGFGIHIYKKQKIKEAVLAEKADVGEAEEKEAKQRLIGAMVKTVQKLMK